MQEQKQLLNDIPLPILVYNQNKIVYGNQKLNQFLKLEEDLNQNNLFSTKFDKQIKQMKKIKIQQDSGIKQTKQDFFQFMKNAICNYQTQDENKKKIIFTDIEITIKEKIKKLHLQIELSTTLHKENFDCVMISITDLTVFKDQELSKKLNQQNQIFQSISMHELGNPLNGQILALEQLNNSQLQSQDLELVQLALQSTYHFKHTLSNMRDFGKMKQKEMAISLKNVDLLKILKEMVKIFSYQAKHKNIQLIFDENIKLDAIISDETKLFQIFFSVLTHCFRVQSTQEKIQIQVENYNEFYNIKISFGNQHVADNINQYLFELELQDTNFLDTQCGGINLHVGKKLCIILGGNMNIIPNDSYGAIFDIYVKKRCDMQDCLRIAKRMVTRISDIRQNDVIQNNEQKQKINQIHQLIKSRQLEDELQSSQQFDLTQLNEQKQKINEIHQLIKNRQLEDELESPQLFDITDESKVELIIQQNMIEVVEKKCDQCAKVLVIDDIMINVIAIKCAVKKYVPLIDEAYEGQTGLQKIKASFERQCGCGPYKLVFTDINMPKLNGIEMIEQFFQEQKGRTMQFIVISGGILQSQVEYLKQMGVLDVVEKPLDNLSIKKFIDQYVI